MVVLRQEEIEEAESSPETCFRQFTDKKIRFNVIIPHPITELVIQYVRYCIPVQPTRYTLGSATTGSFPSCSMNISPIS